MHLNEHLNSEIKIFSTSSVVEVWKFIEQDVVNTALSLVKDAVHKFFCLLMIEVSHTRLNKA